MTDIRSAFEIIRQCPTSELGDPLLAERVRVVRELDAAALRLSMAQRTLDAARDAGVSREGEANLRQWVNEARAEVERLGDRLLQIAASPSAPASTN